MVKKTRKCTLLSGILDIIISLGIGIFGVMSFIVLTTLDNVTQVATLGILMAAAYVILIGTLIITIGFFISGIILIRVSVTSDEKYAKRRGLLITYFVLDILLIILCIIGIVTSTDFLLYGGVVIAAILVSFILKAIDYSLFWKHVKKGEINLNKPVNNVEQQNIKSE